MLRLICYKEKILTTLFATSLIYNHVAKNESSYERLLKQNNLLKRLPSELLSIELANHQFGELYKNSTTTNS